MSPGARPPCPAVGPPEQLAGCWTVRILAAGLILQSCSEALMRCGLGPRRKPGPGKGARTAHPLTLLHSSVASPRSPLGAAAAATALWKGCGLLERPVLPPHTAADIASYKVFVSGRSAVGKTALVACLAGLQVPSAHHETTGIQTTTVHWPAKLRESGRPLFFRFTFWDCGESVLKKFDHILPACTEKVDGFLFLFSFTDRASFDDLPGQISRVTEGAAEAVKIVIGTKFDQFAHTDVTKHDLAAFRRTWGLPVLRAKSVGPPGSCAGLSDVAHLLNGLAEHLWRQDQWAAGLLPPGPGSKDCAADGSVGRQFLA